MPPYNCDWITIKCVPLTFWLWPHVSFPPLSLSLLWIIIIHKDGQEGLFSSLIQKNKKKPEAQQEKADPLWIDERNYYIYRRGGAPNVIKARSYSAHDPFNKKKNHIFWSLWWMRLLFYISGTTQARLLWRFWHRPLVMYVNLLTFFFIYIPHPHSLLLFFLLLQRGDDAQKHVKEKRLKASEGATVHHQEPLVFSSWGHPKGGGGIWWKGELKKLKKK